MMNLHKEIKKNNYYLAHSPENFNNLHLTKYWLGGFI